MKNIYAVLVTYNPNLNELNSNINLLKMQVDKIVLCNNSSFDILLNDDCIVEFNFGDNLGIAKAQSIGMKWAFENGAEFILQMDQDSAPSVGMVSNMYDIFLNLRSKNINIGLVGPIDYDRDTLKINEPRLNKGRVSTENSVLFVNDTLSSGSLISKDAYEAVGGMNDDLFIDVVDFEYCWRLREKGYLVARCLDVKLAHRLGDGSKLLFGLIWVGVPAPIRHYYAFRNTIYLLTKKNTPKYWILSSTIKMIFKYIFYRFAFPDGSERLMFMKLGIRDGINSKLGRIDKKR